MLRNKLTASINKKLKRQKQLLYRERAARLKSEQNFSNAINSLSDAVSNLTYVLKKACEKHRYLIQDGCIFSGGDLGRQVKTDLYVLTLHGEEPNFSLKCEQISGTTRLICYQCDGDEPRFCRLNNVYFAFKKSLMIEFLQ